MTEQEVGPRDGGVVAAVGTWPRDQAVVVRACAEAQRRSTDLTVLHVDDARFAAGVDRLDPRTSAAACASLRDRATAAARSFAPGLRVTSTGLVGSAQAGIVRSSRHADLVVLGAEGASPLTLLARGGVTANVAARARSLVEVVPTGAASAATPPETVQRVVAVVSAGADVDTLLAVAFDQAERCQAPLDVLVSRLVTPTSSDAETIEVGEALLPWRRAHPEVAVEVVVLTGRPPAVVLATLGPADLLVVPRGSGEPFWGRPDGATLALLDRAPCPVVVVPPRGRVRAVAPTPPPP